jgi:hypothetical protein
MLSSGCFGIERKTTDIKNVQKKLFVICLSNKTKTAEV